MRFKHRLVANGIGGRTVAELDRNMSHSELVSWMAFYKLEPFGDEIANWRAGLICAVISNALGGKKSKPKQPTDFMPKAEYQRQRDLNQQILSTFAKVDHGHKNRQPAD